MYNAFKAFCQQKGIRQELTEGYTPRVAERANRTLVEMARSMRYHHKLPLSRTGETDVQQASLATSLGHKPDVSHLRTNVWLCRILSHTSLL